MRKATKVGGAARVNLSVTSDVDEAIKRLAETSGASKSAMIGSLVAFYDQMQRYATDGLGVFVRDGKGVEKPVKFQQNVSPPAASE